MDDLIKRLEAAQRENEGLRGAIYIARDQIVAFSIKEIGAEAAVKNVKYLDDILKGPSHER